MAKITTKIELTENDLLKVLASHYNLKSSDAKINIRVTENDRGQGTQTTITIEGVKST
jgi:hypothetical protein|tara:strand:+ start:1740 stop:1913 length:174 start_codon:yes stop_codon:yes gene_type:complete